MAVTKHKQEYIDPEVTADDTRDMTDDGQASGDPVGNFDSTPDVIAPRKQMLSQNYTPNQTGWALYPDGAAQFQSIQIKNTLKTIPENGDIQGAINLLKDNGGGVLQLAAGTYYPGTDIVGASNVSLVGAGIGQTILDFGSANIGVKYAGNTTTAYVENFKVTDLTIKDSNLSGFEELGTRSGGLHIKYARHFEIRNVRSTSCSGDGAKVEMGENFNISNCQFDNNGVDGLEIVGNSYYGSKYFTVQNCFADTNTKDGFQTTYADVELGSFINCHAVDSGQNGFYFVTTESVASIGCTANDNGYHGFSFVSGSHNFIGCFAYGNSQDGFYMDGGSAAATACQGWNSGNINFHVAERYEGRRIALVGNVYDRAAASNPTKGADLDDSNAIGMSNAGQAFSNMNDQVISWNNTGSTITKGSVVTRKATADGYQIETTTTQGDPNVVGMAEHDIENNETSEVLTAGKTVLLRANGEENIGIGDWLQTSTVAGVSMRASTAGQTVFAKSLQTYATGAAGTVAALLVYPRSI